MIDEAFRIVPVILVDGHCEPDVRRLLENALERQQSARMRIDHFGSADHDPSVAGIVRFVETGPGIVEQRNERSQFLGRAGFQIHPDRIVEILDDPLVAVTRQVRHRTDLARSDLHQDRRAPIGLHGDQLVAQRFLGHVLNIDVERRHHVDSVHGIDVHLVGHGYAETARNALHHHAAVDTPQHAVERPFDPEPRSRLVDHPDRTGGHPPVRQHPLIDLPGDETAAVLSQTKQREFRDLFYFQMIDPSGGNQRIPVLFPVAERIDQHQLVCAFTLVAEKGRETARQRIDVAQKDRVDQTVRREVHAHFVHRNGRSQNASVASQHVAPIGLQLDALVSDRRPLVT